MLQPGILCHRRMGSCYRLGKLLLLSRNSIALVEVIIVVVVVVVEVLLVVVVVLVVVVEVV